MQIEVPRDLACKEGRVLGPEIDLNYDSVGLPNADGVVVVEWGDVVAAEMPADRLEVRFAFGDDDLKARDDAVFNVLHLQLTSEKILHRRYSFSFTGDDQVEETEIGVYIQREPVRGDPTCNVNANGRNFSAGRMYACEPFNAKGVDFIVGERADQDLFQVTHKSMNVFAIGTEVDNRITNDLAQTMIGNFPAAICFEDTDAARR